MNIAIVGCGFLGSIAAEEIAKRAFAFEQKFSFTLVDFDTLEPRNCANQNFTLRDCEERLYKASVVALRVRRYGMKARPSGERLEASNCESLLKDVDLIVDAVDNIKTRHIIYAYAHSKGIPVMHLGVSQDGVGEVSWTLPNEYCSWSLAPSSSKFGGGLVSSEEFVNDTLPPCELIAFRGLGLNMGIAAAKALFIWLGMDAEQEVSSTNSMGAVTTWRADNRGHTLESIWRAR